MTATTFSIVAVFVPVGFMPGIAGQFFKPFALTIAAAVLVSLFVSFSLDPMLSAVWPDPQLAAHERRNVIARALEHFNRWFDRQAERYTKAIGWALDHRVIMLVIAVTSFVVAIGLQVAFGGFGFAPLSDNSELNVAIETPPSSTVEYTALKAEEVASIARRHKEVAYTYTTVGSSSGSGAVDAATVYVRMVPKTRPTDQPGHLRTAAAQRAESSRRSDRVHVRRRRTRWQSEGLATPASRTGRQHPRTVGRADRRLGARRTRRGGRRALVARTEAGVQRRGESRSGRARSA